jgi:hypothetical protein
MPSIPRQPPLHSANPEGEATMKSPNGEKKPGVLAGLISIGVLFLIIWGCTSLGCSSRPTGAEAEKCLCAGNGRWQAKFSKGPYAGKTWIEITFYSDHVASFDISVPGEAPLLTRCTWHVDSNAAILMIGNGKIGELHLEGPGKGFFYDPKSSKTCDITKM